MNESSFASQGTKVYRPSRLYQVYHFGVLGFGGHFVAADFAGCAEADVERPDNSGGPKVSDGKQFRAFLRQGMSKSGAEELTGIACSMEQLSSFLRRAPGVDRRVVDKTGLTGKYDFTLTFAASPGVGPATGGGSTDAAAPDDSAPSIFTALEDQLGLRLQRGVGTIDTVAVEHVERSAAD